MFNELKRIGEILATFVLMSWAVLAINPQYLQELPTRINPPKPRLINLMVQEERCEFIVPADTFICWKDGLDDIAVQQYLMYSYLAP